MTTSVAASLEERIKDRARELGFDPVGITALGPALTFPAFLEWIERGFSGEMTYLPRGADKRRDTRLPFAGARSAIVVALDYGGKQPAGTLAPNARGDDYPDVMPGRLNLLHQSLSPQYRTP